MFIRFNKIVTIAYVPGAQHIGSPGTWFLRCPFSLCAEKDLEVWKKVVPLHSHLKNGWLRVLKKTDAEQENEKFLKKDLEIKKCFVPLQPRSKNGFSQEKREVHWKDWLLYKKQVPRKNTIYREALIPYGIISVRTDWKYKNIYTMKSLILAQDER